MKIVTSQDSSVQQERGSPNRRVTKALAHRAGRQRSRILASGAAPVHQARPAAILCDIEPIAGSAEANDPTRQGSHNPTGGTAIGAAPIYALSIPERQTGRVISALARLVRETPDSPARPLYCLDGGNAFNPYRLTAWMRRRGYAPTPWLDHIFVSRAYTCHQLISSAETLLAPLTPAKPPAKPVYSGRGGSELEPKRNALNEAAMGHGTGAPVKPVSPDRGGSELEPNRNALNEALSTGPTESSATPLVALLGIDHLFLDEDLPMWERRYLFGRLMNLVAKYTNEGLPMLITFGVERPNPWARQIARVARVLPGPGDGQPDRLGESLEKIEAAFSGAGQGESANAGQDEGASAGKRTMATVGPSETHKAPRRHRPNPPLDQPTQQPFSASLNKSLNPQPSGLVAASFEPHPRMRNA